MAGFSRRDLLKTAGVAAGAAAATHVGETQAAQQQAKAPETQLPNGEPEAARQHGQMPKGSADVLFFFNEDEAKFMRAAIDRLIPGDETWGGAEAAGVLYYIDRQLASAYGAGAKMYLKGPWNPNAPPQQGYQLRYSPAELYRVAIEELMAAARKQNGGKDFWDLSDEDKDKTLKAVESGELQLQSTPSPVFFETLLANTVEGFFSDPAYGGNRGMVAWRMIGFPGAYAQYVGLVDQHGIAYTREPLSIATSFAELGRQDAQHAGK